jgi:RNA polymerase sigma factor (sigma-70 family)
MARVSTRKKDKKQGLLDNLLGFTPSEDLIAWVVDNYHGKTVPYLEIDRLFLLDVHPNYHTGIILSIFDLCNAKVHPQKEADLPRVNVKEVNYREEGSFIDEYIREISVFPTLDREQELDLAKLMEVAYLRYKSSLCYCPVLLDILDEEIECIRSHPTGENAFHLSRFKALVVPGSSKLTYPQLWKVFQHQWKKIMEIRSKMTALGSGLEGESQLPRKDMIHLLTYKAAIAFMLKDLNIKESYFHQSRDRLMELEPQYPNLKLDFERVRRCYDRYIECKNLMVNYNLKLVVSIARKFFRAKVSPMDVIQYGNEGLIRAAEDYNYKLKFKFSTYAIWWIRQKIQEGVQEQEHMIRIPAYRLHLNRKYNAIKDRLTQEGEGVVTDEDLSGELEMSIDQIKKLRRDPAAFVISPTSNGEDDESTGSILDQLVDTRSEQADELYDEDATQALKRHLRLYPVRERFILALRYGLECEDIHPVSLSEGELEERFATFDEETTDKEIDDSMEPVLYRFEQLSEEIRVTPAELKVYKTNQCMGLEVAQNMLPFSLEELEQWRQEAKEGRLTSIRGCTVLAMVDGRDFDEYVKAKARDRIVLAKIWLEIMLSPSVVRKILNREGLILEEVARVFGLTKERVRQLEAKILRNISYHLVLP